MTFLSPKVLSLGVGGKRKRQVCVFCTQSQLRFSESCRKRRSTKHSTGKRQETRQLGQLSVAQRVHGLMEAKKIKEEAAASVDADAMEQEGDTVEDGIERKLKLMEGGGKKTVNGPLIPVRR